MALARKVGFKEEGLLREEIFFDGKYHDSIAFGLLKNEYETRKVKPLTAPRMPS